MNVDPVPAEVASPVARQDWEAVYQADRHAMPSHSPRWAEAVVATRRYRDASRLYSFADGSRAVLPLFAQRGAPPGLGRVWSPPSGWGYGGTISSRPLTPAHLATVFEDLAAARHFQIHLRPNPLDAALWDEAAGPRWVRGDHIVHVLDLAGGFEKVWKERIRPRARTTINKAERAGLDVECGSEARLVDEFYGLLELSFGRWARHEHRPVALAQWNGRRRDPASRFHLMARTLGSMCRVWVARHEGEPAAAMLVLQDRNAHYTRGAMNEDIAGPTSAAYLLQRLAIEAACEAGCRHYHMGDTGNRASLAQFKTRFGAVATPHAEFRLERLPLSWIDRQARGIFARAVGTANA